MHQASPEQYRKSIAAIVAAARSPKSVRGRDTKRFLQAYYANVDADDIAARDSTELASAALSHLRFARQRRGRALVRVFNPTQREHGYSSPHTVIEMVNDDMPFLVDSIGLALTRRALTLHFLTHPVFAVTRDKAGVLRSVEERGSPADKRHRLESFQHVEVDRIVDPATLQSLCAEIERGMRDVRVGVCRLGQDARGRTKHGGGFEFAECALRSARRERGAGPARMDGRSAFHLPRLPGIRLARP